MDSFLALVPSGVVSFFVPYRVGQGPRISLAGLLLLLHDDRPVLALRGLRNLLRAHVNTCRTCIAAERSCASGDLCSFAGEDTTPPTVCADAGNTAGLPDAPVAETIVFHLNHALSPQPGAHVTEATPSLILCHGCMHYTHKECWSTEMARCQACAANGGHPPERVIRDPAADNGVQNLCDEADAGYF